MFGAFFFAVCPFTAVVVVHDGVRPFVDETTLLEVTLAAQKYGVFKMVNHISIRHNLLYKIKVKFYPIVSTCTQ